uniref:TSP1_spondin domain-containing protein n=1 Tax=Ascaris lumbricoides TaxID=6252 RepID=A0A0M3IRA2_ASCLU
MARLCVNCTAEWRPSVWGQCSRTCGDGGVQMRLLRCVWRGTRKAAGRHCQTSTRPSAIRACVHQRPLPPCHSTPPAGGVAPFKGWENWRGWRLYNWNTNHKLPVKI